MRATATSAAAVVLHLLLISLIFHPLSSSTTTTQPRRILHQPLLPQDSPPAPPPAPSPPKYPFTTSAPDNSPFFQSYPSPPPPPSPASFATFPANISSLTVPDGGPSKANSTSSKLIIVAVAAVVAAVTVVSLAVFLHLRHRTTSRRSTSFNQGKPQSDTSSAVSFNQAYNSNHIPKLHRPSQSSSEFLYLGTLVNTHALGSGGGGGAAAGATTTNYRGANSRKLDSPELRPLSPLNTQRQNFGNNAEVISSRDDESEEFYSPKGSINGRESSIGAGSASRRVFAAVEVENFNGSTSISSSTHSSSIPGSGSPANNPRQINSIPKSPDLIEIQAVAPLPPQMSPPPEAGDTLLHESAHSSPTHSSSPDRDSRRSEEVSPRNSSVLDQNFEPPVILNSPVHHSTTANSALPETRGLELQACASPSPLELSSPESSPRKTNASDRNVESPAHDSSTIDHNPHSFNDIPPTPEMQGFVLPESASPILPNSDLCDRNSESPVRSNATETPIAPATQLESASPERLMRSEEPSSTNSDVPNHNAESPVRISSPEHHYSTVIATLPETESSVLPESASPLSPGRCSSHDESSPRNSIDSDQNVESPVRIMSPTNHNSNEMPPSAEMEALASPESPPLSPRHSNTSDQDSESPMNSPIQNLTTVNPPLPEMQDFIPSSPSIHSISSEDSSPRISNVSAQSLSSPARNSSSEHHELPSPSSPERYMMENEASLAKTLSDFDQLMKSLSPLQQIDIRTPTPTSTPPPPPPPVSIPAPPPPPPLPPLSKAWLSPKTPTPTPKNPIEPPPLVNPSRPTGFNTPPLISPMQLPSIDSQTVTESPTEEALNGESSSPPKPKLKPLHWDKVRASSDREMVWDQLKCSSFKLNEEMIETLFVVNTPKPNPNEATRWQVLPPPGLDNGDKLLDPKKAQNIAILLKALHVTVDEVCEGLMEGNADLLGTELLESLLKMAPTKEEERKLKQHEDDSPVKLGPAERFLKEVIDIPHAFKRVEALLYVSNFESEVDYLKKSFATLEAACEELRTSRMFLKLLEAVLKTGNRMNVGTNRGDAHAFKLDTLLKLVDVKGADGKTTLLHFVVQEMIRTEGARLSGDQDSEDSPSNNDAKCRKLGLQVVSSLSSELSNVKKAAVMDAEALASDVSKIERGIKNVKEILELNGSANKFADSMTGFVKNAEEENFRVQAQERLALSLVKEITEYFHGNSTMEEPHPFRIFTVVRDFITVLDRVCKDVGMINERTMVSSAHKFPIPVNPMLQRRQQSCSDDESLPLNV